MTQVKYLSLWRGEVLVTVAPPKVLGRDIIHDVAARHKLHPADLTGPSRQRRIAHARQEAMWEIRQRTALSLPNIGHLFGNRDHTTVLHGVRAHEARMCGESAD